MEFIGETTKITLLNVGEIEKYSGNSIYSYLISGVEFNAPYLKYKDALLSSDFNYIFRILYKTSNTYTCLIKTDRTAEQAKEELKTLKNFVLIYSEWLGI